MSIGHMTRTLRDATAEQFLAQIFFTYSCHAHSVNTILLTDFLKTKAHASKYHHGVCSLACESCLRMALGMTFHIKPGMNQLFTPKTPTPYQLCPVIT